MSWHAAMNKRRRGHLCTHLHPHNDVDTSNKQGTLFVFKSEHCDKSQMLAESKYLPLLIGLINGNGSGVEGKERSVYQNI